MRRLLRGRSPFVALVPALGYVSGGALSLMPPSLPSSSAARLAALAPPRGRGPVFLSTPAAGVGSAAALRPRRPSFSTRPPPKLGLAGFALAAALAPVRRAARGKSGCRSARNSELHKIFTLCSNWAAGRSPWSLVVVPIRHNDILCSTALRKKPRAQSRQRAPSLIFFCRLLRRALSAAAPLVARPRSSPVCASGPVVAGPVPPRRGSSSPRGCCVRAPLAAAFLASARRALLPPLPSAYCTAARTIVKGFTSGQPPLTIAPAAVGLDMGAAGSSGRTAREIKGFFTRGRRV